MNNFCSSPSASFLLLYVYTHACVCTCMWRPSFCPSDSLFMRQALSLAWSLPGRLGWLASEPLESARLCSRCWDYKPSYFLCGCWALAGVLMFVWWALPHHFLFKAFLCSQEEGNPILAVLTLETSLCCAAKASLMLVPTLGGGGARCLAPHLAAVVCLCWFSELQEVQLLAQCEQGSS